MGGVDNLDQLLKAASPMLDPDPCVFVCRQASYGDHAEWQPIASFDEAEGLTLVLRQTIADAAGLSYDGVFKRITLQVHSSLTAVGLTAKFTERLAAANISANVFAAFYHDHVFVPQDDAERALGVLRALAEH